ncbi:aspartyl-phosphate phosphatase Spo0E family protein [Alteribacillus iranensis]|uniref:Stage 0 sporulation regulatory protein n=1 Tax=Alteribacillus iranensis TaxID=930128 RepID=A0A1I2DU45_9BACI|nr:aspartyl-phosphate phosphatase Spo0E family protein [Alteribacillus iranensis]SFE83987.1 stage 0 sporulation regulatory protein [Alteribacillus iranensis]
MPEPITLLQAIEEKRNILNKTAQNEPLSSEKVIQLSKELDCLLNKYERVVVTAS